MCISPSQVFVERGPRHEAVNVACGTCWRCRANRINDFVGRCLAEAAYSQQVIAVTLTYRDTVEGDEDYLAERFLTPLHAQKYIRSLRDRKLNLRYLIAGEYGERTARAHFHAILFVRGTKHLDYPHRKRTHVPEWPHGHIYADRQVGESGMRYVAKYLAKSQATDEEERKSWFSMSKKPPLGHDWFMAKAARAVEADVLPSGFEYRPPGVQAERSYLMTGATRRNYLAAILKGRGLTEEAATQFATDWVSKEVKRVETWRLHREYREILQQPYSAHYIAFLQDATNTGNLAFRETEEVVNFEALLKEARDREAAHLMRRNYGQEEGHKSEPAAEDRVGERRPDAAAAPRHRARRRVVRA